MIMYYFCKVTSFIVVHLLNAQKTEILHDFPKKNAMMLQDFCWLCIYNIEVYLEK